MTMPPWTMIPILIMMSLSLNVTILLRSPSLTTLIEAVLLD